MKNIVKFFTVLVTFAFVSTLQAQDKPACSAKKTEQMVETLTEKLSLSDDQVEKVTVILKEGNGNFEEEIKEVLTPEQFTTFQEVQKYCDKKKKSCCKSKKSCNKKEKKSCSSKKKKKSCCSSKKK